MNLRVHPSYNPATPFCISSRTLPLRQLRLTHLARPVPVADRVVSIVVSGQVLRADLLRPTAIAAMKGLAQDAGDEGFFESIRRVFNARMRSPVGGIGSAGEVPRPYADRSGKGNYRNDPHRILVHDLLAFLLLFLVF